MATAVAWNEGEAQSILRRHAGREGALLPILHDFQATFGCVPPAAVRLIADALERDAQTASAVQFRKAEEDLRHREREIADKAAVLILDGAVSEDGAVRVDVADGELTVTAV